METERIAVMIHCTPMLCYFSPYLGLCVVLFGHRTTALGTYPSLPTNCTIFQDMAFEKQREELIAMQKTGSDLRVASLGEARVNNTRRRKEAGKYILTFVG